MKTLYNAIKVHSGLEDSSIIDAANYGANGGFSGFIYYSETLEFFNSNKNLVLNFAKDFAEEMGTDSFSMIASFNCLKDLELDATDIAEAIYEPDSEHEISVKNALAWFALEEVGRWLDDNPELGDDFEEEE